MKQESLTLTPRGLYLQASELTDPQGALSQADNVVIGRDNVLEPRRGGEVRSARALARLVAFKAQAFAHDGGYVLTRSADSGATWNDYAAGVAPPAGSALRAAEANGNLYLAGASGIQRLDAPTGVLESAGVPGGLDVQATLTGSGSSMAANNQRGYYALWGKRDANQNVLLGAPSGRGVITNPNGGAASDVLVSATMPSNLPAGAFLQVYRTPDSGAATTDPGVEAGLIYESPAPAATTATLSRSGSTVTATTPSAHGYQVGQIVRVSPGGAEGTFFAVGENTAGATSTDGSTWTIHALPAGTWYGVAANGSIIVAVGDHGIASSPDGITWTMRSTAGLFTGVTWNGAKFVAVGFNIAAVSSNGTSWSLASAWPSGFDSYDVAWNGSVFCAVGAAVGTAHWAGATSPDGLTWTLRYMPSTFPYVGIVTAGSQFVALAQDSAATSSDGATWTKRTLPAGGGWSCIAYSGSRLLVLPSVGGTTAAYSDNGGVSWTATTAPGLPGAPAARLDIWNTCIWTGTSFLALGGTTIGASSADGVTWSTFAVPAVYYWAVAMIGVSFSAGEKMIASVASTTFTYSEAGSSGSIATTQAVTPLTASFTDSVPTGYTGTTLYTCPSQQGISQANNVPPIARDLALYRGSLFYGQTTDPATLRISMLAVGGTLGIQSGDTITINGVTWVAGASESITSRTFLLTTSGTPSQNIAATTASLIRIINRTGSSPAIAIDVSIPDLLPGAGVIQFSGRDPTVTLTLTVSRSSAWILSGTNIVAPQTYKNQVRWSKQLQPDAVPALNYANEGSSDKAVLRVLATRDSVFIFKEDGLWRLTGESPPWVIYPFDPTCILKAPESAVVLDNSIFALTNQGVVRVTDTGVSVLSRPIETAILPLLSSGNLVTTQAVAFGVAYESNREYRLSLPTVSADTQATQTYVYNLFTEAWYRDTRPMSHAIVNPADDRLYFVDGASCWRERKDFATSDYADGTDAIPTTVAWVPRFSATPARKHQFSTFNAMYRSQGGSSATLQFWTDLVSTPGAQTIAFSTYGTPPLGRTNVRTLVPRENSRGSQFYVQLQQSVLNATYQLEGLGLTFRTTTREAGY